MYVYMVVVCAQLCLTLRFHGSSLRGIFQARILEWVAISFSREPSQPRNGAHIFCVSCIAGRFFTTGAIWDAPKAEFILMVVYICMFFL